MDLQWGIEQWRIIFRYFGIAASLRNILDDLKDRVYGSDVEIFEYNDVDNQLSNWSLTGVKFDQNTDPEGKIYVKLYYDGSSYYVELYSDSGLTQLVASGSISSSSGDVTLSEENDSGLSGSVTINYLDDTSSVYLLIKMGALKQVNDLDESDERDAEIKAAYTSMLSRVKTRLEAAISVVENFISNDLTEWLAQKMDSSETSAGGGTTDEEGDDIVYDTEGIIGDLADNMADESTSTPTVFEGVMFTTSTSADPDNQGSGGVTDLELMDGCPNGNIILTCNDETIGSETFEVVFRRDDDGSLLAANNDLQVKCYFAAPEVGIKQVKITRNITCSGTSSSSFTNWNFSGETSSNTNDGILYASFSTSTNLLEIFKASSRTSDVKVAQGTWDGVDGSTITLTPYNSSGLSGSVVVSSPSDTDDLVIDLNCFKEGDRIKIEVSQSADPQIQRNFWEWFRIELPGDNEDDCTIKDGLFERGF